MYPTLSTSVLTVLSADMYVGMIQQLDLAVAEGDTTGKAHRLELLIMEKELTEGEQMQQDEVRDRTH